MVEATNLSPFIAQDFAMIVRTLMLTLLFASFSSTSSAQERYWQDDASPSEKLSPRRTNSSDLKLVLATEVGLLDVLSHKIQQDSQGTYFDYTSPSGGQRTFEFFWRISAEVVMNKNHRLIFLYQPLRFEKQTRLNEDLVVDDITFPEGKMMNLTYGFDFYRLIYSYDFVDGQDTEFSFGGGFQMRNAIVSFVPVDGSEGRSTQNLGPVPLLHLRYMSRIGGERWWFGAEADGFYANLPVANGGTENIEGLIADVSLRVGYELSPGLDTFFNLRYLGGGAEGTSEKDADEGPGDGFTRNWLHTATVSLGFYFEPGAYLD